MQVSEIKELKTLMSLIETGVDNRFYTRSSDLTKEISFSRAMNPLSETKWVVREVSDPSKSVGFSEENVLEILSSFSFDPYDLLLSLRQTITTEIAYLRARARRIRKELGETAYVKAEKEWEDFGKKLKDTVELTLRRNKIKLVK